MTTDQDAQGTSTRPYLIRALHDWCTDNGFTPYIAAYVDRSVQVPQEYVKNNEIVLNVSFEATSQLTLGNEFVEFKARFGGKVRDIIVPVDHVVAIYARENGQGMAFPVPSSLGGEGIDSPAVHVDDADDQTSAPSSADQGDKRPLVAVEKAAKKKTVLKAVDSDAGAHSAVSSEDEPPEPPPAGGGRPTLRRIK